MRAPRWWSALFARSPLSRVRRRAPQVRPVLETLEDRTLLSGLTTSQVAAAYGQLPLGFEANQGQSAAPVSFLAHGPQSTLFLTSSGSAVLSLAPQGTQPGDVLEVQLQGANPSPTVSGQDVQQGTSNYLLGSDPNQWHTNIANYGAVDYQGVYAGIDLRYYGTGQHLEYDFVVAAGANPDTIRLGFAGQQGLSLDGQGNLLLQTAAGTVVQQAPVLYQVNGAGTRTAVSGQYVLETDGTVGFQVGAYDSSRALIIDPVLAYSTYLGGSGNDYGYGIAVDGSGNAYVTGSTASSTFPTTAGAFQTTYAGSTDAFVTKLNASGTAPLYSTYLGGSGNDGGNGIAVDGSGNAYVAGYTNSSNFPTTPGAFQTYQGNEDAFVAKFNLGPPPSPAPPPAPPLSAAPSLASPLAEFTFLVKSGKHWYLLIWNSDPAAPFLGYLFLEGLSKKQAKALHLPNAATPLFLFLPPGFVFQMALPFTPSGSLRGIAF
jgi:hypothetical protein